MPKLFVLLLMATCVGASLTAANADASRWYVQASQQYLQKRYDDALQSLKQSLKDDPRQAAAYQLAGYCFQAKGDDTSALRYYRYSLQLDSANPALAALAGRVEAASQDPLAPGHALYREKRYSDALALYTRVGAEEPNNARAYQSIGNCQYAMGDRIAALASYRHSLQMDPSNAALAVFVQRLSLAPVAVAAIGPGPGDWIQPVWRSAILPGWGQAYNGQTTKGVLLGGVTLGLLAGEVATYVVGSQAEQTYLSASGPTADYNTPYNTWSNMAQANHVFYIGMTAMYVYTLIDAYLNAKAPKLMAVLPQNVSLAFCGDGAKMQWDVARF